MRKFNNGWKQRKKNQFSLTGFLNFTFTLLQAVVMMGKSYISDYLMVAIG